MSKNLSDFTLLEMLIILILNADKGKPVRGKTWLQKMVFILNRNIEEINAIFDGYYIGPYSEQVEIIINQFEASGYIAFERSRISLTPKGKDFAELIEPNISKKRMDLIEQVKIFMNDLTRKELIAFIYSSFEEYTSKSDVLDVYERVRIPASISLYKKGKVSLGKASEIAGLTQSEFIKIYNNKTEMD